MYSTIYKTYIKVLNVKTVFQILILDLTASYLTACVTLPSYAKWCQGIISPPYLLVLVSKFSKWCQQKVRTFIYPPAGYILSWELYQPAAPAGGYTRYHPSACGRHYRIALGPWGPSVLYVDISASGWRPRGDILYCTRARVQYKIQPARLRWYLYICFW